MKVEDAATGVRTDPAEELDVKRADRSIWLVKVPNFVVEVWKPHLEPTGASSSKAPTVPPPVDDRLGTVCLAFDPTAQAGALPVATLRLAEAGASAVPRDYELTFQPDVMPMHVFSRDHMATGRMAAEGKAHVREKSETNQRRKELQYSQPSSKQEDLELSVVKGLLEGGIQQRVEYKLDAKPLSVEDAMYNQLSKRRMEMATKKTRTVQVMDDRKARGAIMRPLPVNASGKGVKGFNVSNKSDERRARMDKEQLLDMIFKLFERQSYWAFKQLVAETDQPAVWLKEVLQDVCRFNKRGPNADKWEVKPEYKHTREDGNNTANKKPKLEA